MDIIQLLPDSIANQIAAGEVVQRPASVVKELVENAIDAGAKQITIHIKDAGKTLIHIVDDGCGMSETDARMAFERHATSKIRQATDLFCIQTMGFRGEALASIAAVAQVEMKTKPHDAEMGSCLEINGSKIIKQEPCVCESGTQFSVKNLFFNIPARRKFLKKDSTEFKHILDEVQRVAIVNTEVSIKLYHNDKEVFILPKANPLKRLSHIFGKSITKSLVAINSESSLVKISGYIGVPESAKKNSGQQFFFVNGRFMKHPYFFKTLINTYSDILPSDLYPSFFVFFEIDPADIDINIHPTKTEIKFENEYPIAQILAATVKEAIGKFNFTSSMNFDTEDLPISRNNVDINNIQVPEIPLNPDYNPFNEGGNVSKSSHSSSSKSSSSYYHPPHISKPSHSEIEAWNGFQEQIQDSSSIPEQKKMEWLDNEDENYKDVFQWGFKYIVMPTEQGLMVVHQRRAHQRLLYEEYLSNFQSLKVHSQSLIFPIEKEMSESELLMIEEVKTDLETLGFKFLISERGISIEALPDKMKESQAISTIEGIIQDFEQFNTNIEYERQKYLSKVMSYNASIGYTSLTKTEMQDILRGLFKTSEPAYSPMGKRIFTHIPLSEVENKLRF